MKNEKLPETMWLLRDNEAGTFIRMDIDGDPLLTYQTPEAAAEGGAYHAAHWDIDCTPVAVRVLEEPCNSAQ